MIDRKSLAAGDDSNLEQRNQPELLPLGRDVTCTRCGQLKELFGHCAGCQELDKSLCQCNHTLKSHVFDIGKRSNKRFWHCVICSMQRCEPLADPIKQIAIVRDIGAGLTRTRWENKTGGEKK